MVFEWDDKTSLANEAKHGVGLDFGCYLWDGRVVTLRNPKKGRRQKAVDWSHWGRILGRDLKAQR